MSWTHFFLCAVLATGVAAQKFNSSNSEESKLLKILASMEKKLQNLEESASRLPRLELWLDTLAKKMDRIDSTLSQLAQNVVKTEDSAPLFLRYPVSEERVAVKIDSLSADVLSNIDDIMEKILRLEERMIVHERVSKNQLEKLLDSSNSNLELTASLRTEFTTETRKNARVVDSRIQEFSSKMEHDMAKFLYMLPAARKDKEMGPQIEKLPRNNGTESDITDVHTLLRRVRTNRSRTKIPEGKTVPQKSKMKDAPIMDDAASTLQPHSTFIKTKRDYDLDADVQVDTDVPNCTMPEYLRKMALIAESNLSKSIQQQASLMTAKLANMYEELWRQGKILGSELFVMGSTINQTKAHMDEGFRTILALNERGTFSSATGPIPLGCSSSLDLVVKEVLTNIHRRINDLDERVHVELESMRLTQTGLIETCHRNVYDQQWDSLIEVLERLLFVMENSTSTAHKETAALKNMLQKHSDLVEDHLEKTAARGDVLLQKKNLPPQSQQEPELLTGNMKNQTHEDEEEKNSDNNDYSYVDPEENNE